MASGSTNWGEWLVGGVKTRRGKKYEEEARKQKEEARLEKEKMMKRFWREARQNSYLIRAGCIEEGKPPRKKPKSLVDRMICDTGCPGYEWRDGPGLKGNDPLLPSEQRDATITAYNTRARQCVCDVVRTDCDDIIKDLKRLTDRILDKDLLCGGGIRKKLQDTQIFLQSIEDYVTQSVADPDYLPDREATAEWSIATNKACKALAHSKKKGQQTERARDGADK